MMQPSLSPPSPSKGIPVYRSRGRDDPRTPLWVSGDGYVNI